jgi:hypothetical protein
MSHAFPTEIRREQELHRNRMLPKLLNVSKLGCFGRHDGAQDCLVSEQRHINPNPPGMRQAAG